MATLPDPSPDTISPQSPDEFAPVPMEPGAPSAPPETPGIAPDFDQPDRAPSETPPPL